MQTKKPFIGWMSLLFLLLASVRPGLSESLSPDNLQITLLDENGSLLPHAHIYIFSKNKKTFFGTREAYGISTFELPAGDYRLYAGYTEKTNGVIDHYASPEATIHVTPYEPVAVILSVRKAQDDPDVLTTQTVQQMGLDKELAKYLN